jgi:hypothetical protein
MVVLSLYLSKSLEIDQYFYYCERRESVPRYPSTITDYTYSGVAWRVAQATVCAAWWLGQVGTFAIDFRLIYYTYIYIIIT